MIKFESLKKIAVPEKHASMPIDESMHGVIVDPTEFHICGIRTQMKSGDWACSAVATVESEGEKFSLFADVFCESKPAFGSKVPARKGETAYLAVRTYEHAESGETRHAATLRFAVV